MELSRIIISEINDQYAIYIREIDGGRTFPILIGENEALVIDRRVQGNIPPRPMTHDLIKSVIQMQDWEAQDIVINNLIDHTYYAVIRLKGPSGELIEMDCRPSDAVALTVHYDPPLPIYIEEFILDQVVGE
jgi:uncharacterized protein